MSRPVRPQLGSLVAASPSIPVPGNGETAALPRFRLPIITLRRRCVCGAPTAPRTSTHLRRSVSG